MNHPIYETIGYVASVLVAVSLMMSSILKLRVINLIGAISFVVYGLVIGAYPVAAVNFVIVLINLYHLFEIFTTTEYFKLLEVRNNSEYLKYFLNFYDREIRKFIPEFAYQDSALQRVFFVLRNLVPAGLFIVENITAEAMFVRLDFVIPGYRDFKLGKYVYSQGSALFKPHCVKTLYSYPGNRAHTDYLRRMGFQPEQASDGTLLYTLKLN